MLISPRIFNESEFFFNYLYIYSAKPLTLNMNKFEFFKVCYEFMDKHAMDIIKHEGFLQLSSGALNDVLKRDSFYAPEIEIFSAVQSWVKVNLGVETNEVLSKQL